MKLSELQTNQTGIVLKIHGHGAFRKRVIEMGFVKGHAVKVLLHAPLKDPINYSILGYEISLRRAEADLIEVVAVDDAEAAVIGSQVLTTPPEAAHTSRPPYIQQAAPHHQRGPYWQPQLRQKPASSTLHQVPASTWATTPA